MWVDAQRVGFGARATVWVYDAKEDGDAAHAKISLNVTGGPHARDPSIWVKDSYADGRMSRYEIALQANLGSHVREVKVSLCKEKDDGWLSCPRDLRDVKVEIPPAAVSNDPYMVDRRLEALRLMNNITLTKYLDEQSQNWEFQAQHGGRNVLIDGFTWYEDGCSNDKNIFGFADTWNPRFERACIRHDFGYKNIGVSEGGSGYLVTDEAREAIDKRFRSDLYKYCDGRPLRPVTASNSRAKCLIAAKLYYEGVRQGGGRAFYGQSDNEPGAKIVEADRGLQGLEDPEGTDPADTTDDPPAGGDADPTDPPVGPTPTEPPGPDTTAPVLPKPVASLTSPNRAATFELAATDNVGVTEMRVRVSGEEWRSWVPYARSGTVVLPDQYGVFTIWFQVRDAAGNQSFERAADNVTRSATVDLTLNQVLDNGTVRTCGSTQTNPCSDVAKRFRATISSPITPQVDLLLKAWRLVNGSWVETSSSPFKRYTITGTTMTLDPFSDTTLLNGLWRFQLQVPRASDGRTDFGASNYQYRQIG
jgi:Prokaryotic phospholipase A2